MDHNNLHKYMDELYSIPLPKKYEPDYKERYKKRQKAETYADRALKSTYKDKYPNQSACMIWEKLTDYQRIYFACVTIKGKMLSSYTDSSNHQKIEGAINLELGDELYKIGESLEAYNNSRIALHKSYYNENDPESEKRKKHKKFNEALAVISSEISLPSFEDWVNMNKRVADYQKNSNSTISYPTPFSYYQEWYTDEVIKLQTEIEEGTYYTPATDAEIDHVILQVIMSNEKCQSFSDISRIDVAKIKECVTYLKNYDFDDMDDLPDGTGDDQSEDEIWGVRKYFTYRKMLAELDFMNAKEKDDEKSSKEK